jgi:hypothetical protein
MQNHVLPLEDPHVFSIFFAAERVEPFVLFSVFSEEVLHRFGQQSSGLRSRFSPAAQISAR